MNDITQQPQAGGDARLENLRNLTMVTYILYAVSVLVGITAIVAIIVNYIKRDETQGTIYESHFTWQIRTFWWSLVWFVVGWATIWMLGLGAIVLIADGIWVIYRIVKGFLNFNDDKPMVIK